MSGDRRQLLAKAKFATPIRPGLIFVFLVTFISVFQYQTSVGWSQLRANQVIRDAEIEKLIRDYSTPIFRAAGVPTNSVSTYIINDRKFNAFVADGRRMFLNAGALMDAKTPNQIIGVIAHETGHIAGGHLARLRQQLRKAQAASIIAVLIGAGATAAGAASGSKGAASAGQAVISGGQTAIQRSFLSYRRAEEAAADQAGLSYLNRTGQSARGMIQTFERFADQQLVSARFVDPYVLSHPIARDRIAQLKVRAERSPHYNRKDPASLQLRHDLMRAKLSGFLEHRDTVFRRYKRNDKSLPARYARAIAKYRSADTRRALRDIDGLIKSQPNNPYFWELKGQVLLESSRPREAITALQKAVQLAPNAHLIRLLYGSALVATDTPANTSKAIKNLEQALRYEPDASLGFRQLAIAYGRQGKIINAELATAKSYFIEGNYRLAKQRAARVKAKAKRGSPLWLQADDILSFKTPNIGRR